MTPAITTATAIPVSTATTPEISARISRKNSPAGTLIAAGISSSEFDELARALDGIVDFRKLRPGDRFGWRREPQGRIVEGHVELSAAPLSEIRFDRQVGVLVGHRREPALHTEIARLELTVDHSLYQAFVDAHEDPQLAVELADVLAWDVDFYVDPRPGDRVRAVVEKVLTPSGALVRYGRVLAVEYAGAVAHKKLFYFSRPPTLTLPRKGGGDFETLLPRKGGDSDNGYYDESGRASQRAFLKSPLKYAHVTSHFGMRFHPVLHYNKAHQGVDYAAALGTPVWAVGDGSVTRAGWAGPCGKSVEVRHANGLTSVYCHLSAIETHTGAHVSQKQVIAHSGATGRVTGPHLHYALKRRGHFINPLSVKFPPGLPVQASELAVFQERKTALQFRMEEQLAMAAPPGAR